MPDPSGARDLDDLAAALRALKVSAGNPSFDEITKRVNAAWTAAGRPPGELARRGTVVDCFHDGRRRVNNDLVLAVVRALHDDAGYVAQWHQVLGVVLAEVAAAGQVRCRDHLPDDLTGFTGRAGELARLRETLEPRRGAAVVVTIEGMAGVGKTRLAVHAGHLLHTERPFDQVFFADLRGFHPDPAQPPVDPSAVLDGFLRLLAVPAQRIPYEREARTALFRARLAGRRALVVLDNAVDLDQVGSLLPAGSDTTTLITSRRRIAVPAAVHLTLGSYSTEEAVAYLTRAAPDVPAGPDPQAAARIAERCGLLPLALALVAGHVRTATGAWTLTDHADRLDRQHAGQRMNAGLEVAFDLSYQDLPEQQRSLLRRCALHPGAEFDAHAAAALLDTTPGAASGLLEALHAEHLVVPAGGGRYTLHDLVRTFAANQAEDEEPPSVLRAASDRLGDYYLAAASTAMDALHPAYAELRPRVDVPGVHVPDVSGADTALAWLDAERPALVALAAHAVAAGRLTYVTELAGTLARYLNTHPDDGLTVHRHALRAAQRMNDLAGQAEALANLGNFLGQLGRYRSAGEHLQRALTVFRRAGDPRGEGRALANLGVVESRLGNYERAMERFVEALALYRRIGYQLGEAAMLNNIGDTEIQLGRYDDAEAHLTAALEHHHRLADSEGIAWVRETMAMLHTRRGCPQRALGEHEQALILFRRAGDRQGEAWALNGMGEIATDRQPHEAVDRHVSALAAATEIGDVDQQARAQAGLGHAYRTLGDAPAARRHLQLAVTLYTELGAPEAGAVQEQLAALAPARN
ncbi:tetratricopeptide repeat protein [Paractinoplanes abujensis]|uniref:Tetratricopeptide (TPR) repeat protein n=1 Tax=Paractinoplanes abujensis TaxID=882441 RepID=A0A7W7CPL2_9ACTN|nr:tetratricopeptide repeat protein [Actinoplanes abujensis]MBB4692386.1 tetratricopeptide (TPR) repeat protein [Actinoplanes abujensis]